MALALWFLPDLYPVSRPDKDQAVFIHARVACPHVLLPEYV